MIKMEDVVVDGKPGSEPARQLPPITPEEQDILNHHGVIGMRWGRGRKGKTTTASTTSTTQSKRKTVDERARENQFVSEYKNRDKMSTRSLQNRVKRLQAEQQFRELVNKPAAERAKAAAELQEKKAKRRKMLLRTALSIYGSVDLKRFGKKGKELESMLGPSQEMAKAASGSAALKNSEDLSDVLIHKGVKGMKWREKRTPEEQEAALDQGIAVINAQLASTKDPQKKAELEASLQNYKNNQAETDKFVVARRTPQQTNAALQKGIGVIKASIKESKKAKEKNKTKDLQKRLKLYSEHLKASNKQLEKAALTKKGK